MFFIAVAHVVSLLWQLLSFSRFIMGKVKIGLYFYLTYNVTFYNSKILYNVTFYSSKILYNVTFYNYKILYNVN